MRKVRFRRSFKPYAQIKQYKARAYVTAKLSKNVKINMQTFADSFLNSAAQWSGFSVTDTFLKSCGCNRRNLRSITLLVLLNAELTHLREEKHLLDIASTVLPKKQRLYFHCLIILTS